MIASLNLLIHIFAGAIALLLGGIALLLHKGSSKHKSAGMIYIWSMLLMCALGVYIAYTTPNTITVLAGSLTAYMVVTSWLSVKRKPGTLGQAEYLLVLVPLAVAYSALMHGLEAANSPDGTIEDIPIGASAYYFFACIASVAVVGDLHMLIRRGRTGQFRIARHLWRMCFSLHVAMGSFFEGQAHLFPEAVRESGVLSVPANTILALMFYYLLKPLLKRLFNRFRGSSKPNSESHRLQV